MNKHMTEREENQFDELLKVAFGKFIALCETPEGAAKKAIEYTKALVAERQKEEGK